MPTKESKGLYDIPPMSRLTRFSCSSCTSTGLSKELMLSHICSGDPNLPRTIRRQTMSINIERKPGILTDVPQAYLLSKLSSSSFQWAEGDATLPTGWKVAEWRVGTAPYPRIYQSPGGRLLRRRDQVAEELLLDGTKLVSVNGYKQTNIKPLCSRDCNGSCKHFLVSPDFFSANDPNRFRKKSVKKFFPDYDIDKSQKIRDKNPRSPDKTIYVQKSVTYIKPVARQERPFIVLPATEQSSSQETRIPSPDKSRETPKHNDKVRQETSPNQAAKRKSTEESNRPGKRFRRPERNQEPRGTKRNIRGGRDNALYVQCCNPACQTWRQVREYKDVVQVPDYWVCSMNRQDYIYIFFYGFRVQRK